MKKCRKGTGVQQTAALQLCEFLHVLLFPNVCLDFTYCPGKINCLHISENLVQRSLFLFPGVCMLLAAKNNSERQVTWKLELSMESNSSTLMHEE